MLAQTKINYAKTLSNVKRIAEIKFRLSELGLTQKKLAIKLGVTPACICRVISGAAKSKRVSNWLKENLGI